MESKLLLGLGKIAGIAGVALGVALFVFRDVAAGLLQGKEHDKQSLNVVFGLLVLTFGIAAVGIFAWIVAKGSGPKRPVPSSSLIILALLTATVLAASIVVGTERSSPPVAPSTCGAYVVGNGNQTNINCDKKGE